MPVSYLDVDDTVRATFGYAKQGAGYGYTRVKGLNALLATVSTASSAPLIVASRLRKGSANSARGAARLVADAIKTSRACGIVGTIVLRADSAYYGQPVIAAAGRHNVDFSVTARKDRAVNAAIAAIPEDAWTPIRYPKAVFDEQLQQWISNAEVAEVPFTAFRSKSKAEQVSGVCCVGGCPMGEETDRVIASRSVSCAPAGYRFPREVIAVAVRW